MNTKMLNTKDRKRQGGNVLFLILIAVALFAALSYAVTQSTRSGSGDASNERSLVNSAALTQYPASLKTAIVRMTVSNGVAVGDLVFTIPADFADLTDTPGDPETFKRNAVFHPLGGGATYTQSPADVMESGAAGTWHFNAENEVKNVGTSVASGTASSAGTADIIGFLSGVSESICDKIHDQLGLGAIPTLTGIDVTSDMDTADPGLDAGGAVITNAALDGQPQGCFQMPADNYIYYHVLVER